MPWWGSAIAQNMSVTVPPPDPASPGALPAIGTTRPVIIAASHGWRAKLNHAARDLGETFRLWPLVWTLSLFDIRLRYRGSLLGPFWLTLSTAVMIGAMGFLYARLFHQNVGGYLPFLTVSLILWSFISTVTSEGATCFTQSESMLRSMRMPHSLHAARVVVRNLLVLAHNIVVVAAVFMIFHIVPSLSAFSLVPAALLWCMDAFALSLLLGIFGARFRDIPPIINSVMQIAFYITPIMWNPDMLAHRGLARVLVEFNPFFGIMEIMRGPLLHQPIAPFSWLLAVGYSALLCLFAGLVFIRARPRIPYWV